MQVSCFDITYQMQAVNNALIGKGCKGRVQWSSNLVLIDMIAAMTYMHVSSKVDECSMIHA